MAQLWEMKDQACIVGIGATEFSHDSGRSELSLSAECIKAAIEDAGLNPGEVDGMVRCSGENNEPQVLASNLGIPELHFFADSSYGGGACPVGTVLLSAMAVASGMAQCVVAYRAMNGYSGRGVPLFHDALARTRARGTTAYTSPFGLLSPAQMAALAARRHMHLYGTRREHFGAIALACRQHAQHNPGAMMCGQPLTMEQYLKAEMLSEPVCVHDFAEEADGGVAVVVTSPERARHLRHPPVYITAGAFGAGGWNTLSMVKNIELPETETTVVARQLFQRAGITQKDIDVVFVYDQLAPLVLMSLEELGFCKRGEGGEFVSSGRLEWSGGSLPLNTSGGNLAEGNINGMQNTAEAVRQLRGTARCQVRGAEFALVASSNAQPTNAMILRR